MTDSRLKMVSEEPFNAETRLEEQVGVITPIDKFYVRNHFPVPRIDPARWELSVSGEVERPLRISYGDLRSLPSRSVLATLECAGNGRASFAPPIVGQEPWEFGAVSTAEWTGTPLATILDLAGVSRQATEIVTEGADRGLVAAAQSEIRYERSLPLDVAREPRALLAYAMNGQDLTPEHGFPARVVVPGWYGMAAVKWVTGLRAIAGVFVGFYQADRYVMKREGEPAAPLQSMALRSLIASPVTGAKVSRGSQMVRGMAWSGTAPVSLVEVSSDGGATWRQASFTTESSRWSWRLWEMSWEATDRGPVALKSRAIDAEGAVQPEIVEWNELGYCNNAVRPVHVEVI
jgi:DMSO/TMAO reductase YedYZ molybdopterin-dependent catalytic subunit